MIDKNRTQRHQVATVRKREGMSLSRVAKRLGVTRRDARLLEDESQDLRISMIYRWAHALDVPVSEILMISDDDRPISNLQNRSKLVLAMKTVESMRQNCELDERTRRLVEELRKQLLNVMPELDDVKSWPRNGTRRGLDDLGKAASFVFSEPTGEID